MGYITDIETGILDASEDVARMGRVLCSRAERMRDRPGIPAREIPTGEAGAKLLGAILNPLGGLHTTGDDGGPKNPSGGGSVFR